MIRLNIPYDQAKAFIQVIHLQVRNFDSTYWNKFHLANRDLNLFDVTNWSSKNWISYKHK